MWGFPSNKARNYMLGWNIMNIRDSLWVKLLKEKYFPRSSFLTSVVKPGASLIWQGLSKTREELRAGICFIPRNDSNLCIKMDPWIPLQPGFSPAWRLNTELPCPFRWLSDLIDETTGGWNLSILYSLFFPEKVELSFLCSLLTWSTMILLCGPLILRGYFL